MTSIALIVQTGSTPSSVATTLDIFNIAARYPEAAGCKLDLISPLGGRVELSEVLGMATKPMPDSLAAYDAVILPGFFAENVDALFEKLAHPWRVVVERLPSVSPSALVAASCYGTFTLAASGLLDGCSATTTWWMREAFRRRFPDVRLDADKALVADGRCITGGAMTAHTDLSLCVLRCLFGARLAREVAGIMLVDGQRVSQKPFMAVMRQFGDPLVQAAAEHLGATLSQTFFGPGLAAHLGVSYRTLHRRFSGAAGMPPLAYLQALRIERARELLEAGRLSTEQIVAAVGYSDLPAFCRLFRRQVGLSPARYRQRLRQALF